MSKIIRILWLLPLGFLQCSGMGDQSLLDADFYEWDLSPPELYLPQDGVEFSILRNPEIVLYWQEKKNILRFRLEIAKDSNFENLVEGFPIYLKRKGNKPPQAVYTFTPKEEGTYYWRVRSEGKKVGSFSEIRKFRVYSAIHVYCAQTESCTSESGTGLSFDPLKKISTAIAKASQVGVPVKVAARGGTAAYSEMVQLVGGVDLLGGYSYPNWEYNPTTNKTIIEITASRVVIANNITEPTVFRGFEVKTTANNLNGDCAFYSYNSSDKVIVEENKFYFGQSSLAQPRYGIILENTNIIFRKNVVEGTTTAVGGHAIGILAKGGSAIIEENQIVANKDIGGFAYGIKLESFQGTIRKNTIIPSTTTHVQNRWGIYAEGVNTSFLAEENTIDFFLGGGISGKLKGIELLGTASVKVRAELKKNTIKLRNGPTGTSLCQGIIMQYSQNSLIANNTIEMCNNPERDTYGIYANFSENLIIRENFISGSGPSQYYPCYQVNIESSKGVWFEKNQLFGCQKAFGNVYGFYSKDSNIILSENQIVGGFSRGGVNYGIYGEAEFRVSTVYLEKNIISGGFNSINNATVYGVYVRSSGWPQLAYLKGNYIVAGKASNTNTVSAAFYSLVSHNDGLLYAQGNILHGGEVTNFSRGMAYFSGRLILEHNLLFSGTGSTESRGVAVSTSSMPGILDLRHNVLITQGVGNLRAILEMNSNSDPTSIINNIFIKEGSGSFSFYYDENTTLMNNLSDINDYNNTTQDSNKPSTGNLEATSGSDIYVLYPAFRFSFDGNGNNSYQGSDSSYEIDNSFCPSVPLGSYVVPMGLQNFLQITSKSCPVVNFTPALSRATTAGEFYFHFPSQPTLTQIFRNKSGSLGLNQASCPTAETTIDLGTGSSTADCLSKYPLHQPQYVPSTSKCQLKFYTGLTELEGNGNWFCETGETCLFYPHIGHDPGTGDLVTSSCNLPGVVVKEYSLP